jgi:hypothetical protein
MHTKSNNTQLHPSFAVQLQHGPGQLTFGPASMADVAAAQTTMTDLQRIVLELDEAGGPLTLDELVGLIKDAPMTHTKRENLRMVIRRDKGRQVTQLPDKRWDLIVRSPSRSPTLPRRLRTGVRSPVINPHI